MTITRKTGAIIGAVVLVFIVIVVVALTTKGSAPDQPAAVSVPTADPTAQCEAHVLAIAGPSLMEWVSALNAGTYVDGNTLAEQQEVKLRGYQSPFLEREVSVVGQALDEAKQNGIDAGLKIIHQYLPVVCDPNSFTYSNYTQEQLDGPMPDSSYRTYN